MATILIISSIVKHLLWRASPLAGGARFYSGGQGPDFIQGTRPPVPLLAPALSTWCIYGQRPNKIEYYAGGLRRQKDRRAVRCWGGRHIAIIRRATKKAHSPANTIISAPHTSDICGRLSAHSAINEFIVKIRRAYDSVSRNAFTTYRPCAGGRRASYIQRRKQERKMFTSWQAICSVLYATGWWSRSVWLEIVDAPVRPRGLC